MRIKFTLIPLQKKTILPINYNYFLTGLVYRFIKNSSEDYSHFLHNEGYKLEGSAKSFKLFTYSMLLGERTRIYGDKIIFEGNTHWQLASPLDVFLQHLITGVFARGQEIEIGPEGSGERFLIERVETLPKLDYKRTMRFSCLSPITASKSLLSPEGPICHYLRPWEEDFSNAIKNNLLKKYKLLTGKDFDEPDFKVTIDTEYMNKRGGKIVKNINFKGTNIIGFMAPFEVTGSPELIEVGYEAGFGEKGSMGFGMVKEIAQTV